ncbi:MAG: PilN domain-containing protein [Nitrospirae bacterium]|nr:PilN domain-containing protein [Nitrospirota bacterium]
MPGKLFGVFTGIEFREDSLTVSILKNGLSGVSLLSSSSFPFKDDDITIAAIREHLKRRSAGAGKAFVTIPDRWALIKFADVPSVKGRGRKALPNMMKYEIERHIPFDMDTVLYDFQVVEETDSACSVVFVTVQKSRAEKVREFLRKLSLEPQSITVSSFAVLNAVELGGIHAGGWKSVIGIKPGAGRLSQKGETNISLHIDKAAASLAVIRNGYALRVRSFPCGSDDASELLSGDIQGYLDEIKAGLDLKGYKKLIVSGDDSLFPGLADSLSSGTGAVKVAVKALPRFSGAAGSKDTKGLAPSVGGCFGELGIGRYRINILPHKLDYEMNRGASFAAKILACIAVSLIVLIGASDLLKQRELLKRIDEELIRNEPRIIKYRELSAELESFRKQDDFLAAVEGSELTIEMLAELTNILPDDTWISNFQYGKAIHSDKENAQGELLIGGYSDSASKLISLLEASPMFENVQFVGSINKTKDKEGFKIKAYVVKPVAEIKDESDITKPVVETKDEPAI